MNRLTLALVALIGLSIYITPIFAEELPNTTASNCNQVLNHLVTQHRHDLQLVGLGAMIMRDDEIIASAVSGERKYRSGVLLSDKDKWHIGSITKSFTATMIARLVERGELTWGTTIGDIFPDSDKVKESWRHVTLEQLLTHTSGAFRDPADTFSSIFGNPNEGPKRTVAREAYALKSLGGKSKYPPGSTWFYSNTGYVIAGVMAEKVTGLPWEHLIREEIFAPLGIRSGGFGPPKDQEGKLEQPRGHRSFLGFIVSTESDNTPLIGPAGTMHITLSDLLLYANDQLQGKFGRGKLLKPETYQHLHTPILNDYAYGWVVNPYEEWANGPVIWHNGSNGMWSAMLAILPNSNTIIAITSNDSRNYSSYEMAWPMLEKAFQLTKGSRPHIE